MINEIIDKYVNDNYSINQLSKEYSCSWGKIKKILIDNNVEIITKRNQYGKSNFISEDLFNKIEDSNSAYWLGFLYADGFIRKDRNEISLELQEKDLSSVQDFHSFCNNKNTIRKHVVIKDEKEYVSYVSSFSNEKVKNNLINLGCFPKKSLILTFPTEVQVPDKFLYDFIRGYVDGDGYVQFDNEKSRYRIQLLGTFEFLTGLLERTQWKNGSLYKNNNIYSLELGNKEIVKQQLALLYQNSYYHLQRKYAVYLQSILGE